LPRAPAEEFGGRWLKWRPLRGADAAIAERLEGDTTMLRSGLVLLAAVACCTAAAQQRPALPLDFDGPEALWEPRPTFQADPAEAPEIQVADGAVALRVSEPGRGMKFELQVRPFDSEINAYLVVHYRAENLAGGYAIWVFDDRSGGGEVLNTASLTVDGRWHTAAIDLWAAGAVGAVRSLLTDVRCAEQPASISFDRIWLADEPPAGATVFPTERPTARILTLEAETLGRLTAEPGWLANPTDEFSAERTDTSVVLRVDEPGRGMKWSADLPEPVDLAVYTCVAVRYRARDIDVSGDYCVWLGSAPGGRPPENAVLLRLNDVSDDGHWHVAISPIAEAFTAVSLALQVQSGGGAGMVELDYLRFSERRPLFAAEDRLEFEPGWDASRLPVGTFATTDLSAHGNDAMSAHLRSLGLSSWLEPGPITVAGIPFELSAGKTNVLAASAKTEGRAVARIGVPAGEAYLLIAARLPIEQLRDGGRRQMQTVTTVERFICEVAYEDGVTDEVFPVCVATGRHELRHGVEAYALTELRAAPIREIRLRNHMPSADVVAAAITLNRGAAATETPPVQELPRPAPVPGDLPRAPATVAPTEGGFICDSGLLRMELRTEGGISLRSLQARCPGGDQMAVEPGPLFELGAGETLLTSEQIAVGEPIVAEAEDGGRTLTVPIDGRPGGVPIAGDLVVTVGGSDDIGLWLDIAHVGEEPIVPVVNFPLVGGLHIGAPEDTWYLYCRKGGLVSNRPTRQRNHYGGEHPLQVSDAFNPELGGGLALLTYDLDDIYRTWGLSKDEAGVHWRMEYFGREHQPGERIEVAPTALRAHAGDWRRALAIYSEWAHSWYRPQVPRKPWFQGVFYYQQVTAWGVLRDRATGEWHTAETIERFRDWFGRLDYLHIFDFGRSMVYGRVGDYSHYEELGGLELMRSEIARAQQMGVPVGLYIEGYLCDERGVWGHEHVSECDIRQADGSPLLWPGAPTEHMMCAACQTWRDHLASTYERVAGELQPNGMYIDQYGFTNTWKVCHSREHGHPVPWPPIRGERATTAAIRAAIPEEIASLTEETPNDVNSQHQDGALGYSVWNGDPVLAPHRVDLFRFVFPDFKVLQLTQYDPFTEGDWDLLKFPFFNGEGYWLGGGTEGSYDEEAREFLRAAFAILNDNEDCFCSDDVEPLVPTLRPTVYANRFSGPGKTVWTLFNAEYRTVRGDLLRVPHAPGTSYVNAFTGAPIDAAIAEGMATIPLELGARRVGCVIASGG